MTLSHKIEKQNEMKSALIGLGSPDALKANGIGGEILDAFTIGFEGYPVPDKYSQHLTVGYTAFRAGRESNIKARCTHPNLQEQFPGNHYSTRIRFCDLCEEEVEEVLEDAEAVYA